MANTDKGRRNIDWSAIAIEYRAGVLSLREMGRKHGCAHSTIANFASRHGWSRDGRRSRGVPGAEGVDELQKPGESFARNF